MSASTPYNPAACHPVKPVASLTLSNTWRTPCITGPYICCAGGTCNCFAHVTCSSHRVVWCRHGMEMSATLLALCEGNPLVSGFQSQGVSVSRSLNLSVLFISIRCQTNSQVASGLRRFNAYVTSLWGTMQNTVLVNALRPEWHYRRHSSKGNFVFRLKSQWRVFLRSQCTHIKSEMV